MFILFTFRILVAFFWETMDVFVVLDGIIVLTLELCVHGDNEELHDRADDDDVAIAHRCFSPTVALWILS